MGKRENDEDAAQTLIKILKNADEKGLFQPDVYQVTSWQAVLDWETKKETEWPPPESLVALEIGPGRGETEQLRITWRRLAQEFRKKGSPIPAQIQVWTVDEKQGPYTLSVQRIAYPAPAEKENVEPSRTPTTRASPERQVDQSSLSDLKSAPKRFPLDVDYNPSAIVLDERGLKGSGKRFLEDYATQLAAKKAFGDRQPDFWSLPRWSLPIWKAAKAVASPGASPYYPPEAFIAIPGLLTLESQQMLYSDALLARVLGRGNLLPLSLVEAACHAAGGVPKLTEKIATWWLTEGGGQATYLADLQYKLEDIVRKNPSYPESSSACNICTELSEFQCVSDDLLKDIDNVIRGFVILIPPLRVFLAQNLPELLVSTDQLKDIVLEKIGNLREKIKRRTGITIPGVRFRVDQELPPGQFRVEVGVEHNTLSRQASIVDDILDAVEEQFDRMRPAFLGIDETKSLIDQLPVDLRAWLLKSYRIGELKQIFREVLAENGSDFQDLNPGDFETPRSEQTLAHLEDLVPSLTFWKHRCEAQNYKCLGEKLRKTQDRLLQRKEEAAPVARPLEMAGMTSLAFGKFDEAEREFGERLRLSSGESRELQEKAFLAAYPGVAARLDYAELVKGPCAPKPGDHESREGNARDNHEKITNLRDVYRSAFSESEQCRLELRYVSSLALDEQSDLLAAVGSIDRMLLSNTSDWEPGEKHWLAYLALKTHLCSERAKHKAPPVNLEAVEQILSEATSKLPLDEADDGFEEIAELCFMDFQNEAGAWCGQMLSRVAKLRPESYWIPWALAFALPIASQGSTSLNSSFRP